MREYLFRGKAIDNGEWVFGGLYVMSENFALINGNNFNLGKHQVIPETVGQYTGLCDKNGNKIFEGDIIKNEYGYIGEVVFKACTYYIEWRSGNFSIDLYVWGDSVEVIGNIHDNKNLLED